MATAERESIEQIIEDWRAGWELGDPRLAARAYADDADWTNAFGVTRRGRAAIEAALSEMFSKTHVMAGRDTVVGVEVRLVRRDVAVARTRVERTGQLTRSGEPMGTRQTTHLRVLEHSEAGWRIISHLISDARDLELPRH
jgi:uncharacterized protein (TIGR02246 family)